MSLPLFFTKKLIYTISWEDVTIDQNLLQLDQNSSILTIASAGDHLFTYALEGVSSIHAVDINPIQLHLVELKKYIISAYDFDVFWAFFGVGKVPNYHRSFGAANNIYSTLKEWDFIDTVPPVGYHDYYCLVFAIWAWKKTLPSLYILKIWKQDRDYSSHCGIK